MQEPEFQAISKELGEAWELSNEFQSVIAKQIQQPAKKALRDLLINCKIAIEPEKAQLILEVPSQKNTALALTKRSRQSELTKIAQSLGLRKVIVYTEKGNSFSVEIPARDNQGDLLMARQTHISASNKELATRLFDSTFHCSIVRLIDDFCILVNDEPTRTFTELDPTTYVGQWVGNLWLPQENERLKDFLNKDGKVTDYEYKGYRKRDVLQGIFEPIPLCGDFELVKFMGHNCRFSEFRFG